jgi:uncharacterized membrane protein YkvA (DUF1232 family)
MTEGVRFSGMDKLLLEPVRRRAALVWNIATDRRLPWRARAPAVLALAYAASPIDLVPDSLPGVGWLDDFLVLMIAAAVTPLLVPRALVAEYAGRQAATPDPLAGRSGLVVLPWLLIIIGTMLAVAALIAAMSDFGGAI